MGDNGQDLLVYACSCGFTDPDKTTFNKHLLAMGKKEKGQHKSKGRVNSSTGEIVMPPFDQRSLDQKKNSTYALKKKGTQDTSGAIRQTEIINDATSVRFVPRVLTASFTPIMLSAMTAANRVWGWREDMPFENFIDTVFVHFFRDRGIELAAFVIQNPAEHEEIREKNLALVGAAAGEAKEEGTP